MLIREGGGSLGFHAVSDCNGESPIMSLKAAAIQARIGTTPIKPPMRSTTLSSCIARMNIIIEGVVSY